MWNRRGAWCRDDTGASSLDYIGALVIVGVLLALVVGSVAPLRRPVAAGLHDAVCAVLQLVGADCGPEPVADGPRDEDFKPAQCKIREDTEKGGSEVKLGWFKVGQEFGFVRQEFSDGTVRLTLVDSASIGAVGGGKDKLFDIGKLGDDAKGATSVEVSGGLKFGYGSTWQFDDAAQAEEFREEIETYAMQQQQLKNNPGIAIWYSLANKWADPPDPAITFAKGSVEAGAQVSLGLKVPTGPAGADGKVPTADPNLGGSLTVKGDYEVLIEKNARTGTTSWSYQLSPQIKGNVQAGILEAEGFAKTSGAFRVTRDAQGQLVSLSFVSTREVGGQTSKGVKLPAAIGGVKGNGSDADGGSTATVTATSLALSTPEERRIAEDWLSGRMEQFSSPLNLTVHTMIPDEPAASGDEFSQLMYERATVSETSYQNVTDVQKFGAEVNLGFKLGFSISLEDSSSVSDESSYLGAPGVDGSRPMLDFAECY
jgi:hypothetical protein